MAKDKFEVIKDGSEMVEDGWIELHSGGRFHLMNPRPEEFNIEDIAYALSGMGRYNGHFKRVNNRVYTVAEHSCHIADKVAEAVQDESSPHYVENKRDRLVLQLTALLHDAAEHAIGDMTRPLKVKMLAFKEVEARIDAMVAQVFGTIYPMPAIIKEFDTRILVDERAQGMNVSKNNWATDDLKALGVTVYWWRPDVAEREFLTRFYCLNAMIENEKKTP